MRKSALLVFVGQAVACAAAPAPASAPETPTHAVFVSAPPETAEPVADGPPPDPAARDRDGDGLADGVDACPDVPGVKTSDPKTHGCPGGPPLKGCLTILEEILAFEPNSAVVRGETALLAKRIAESLKRHEEITLIGIEGFANPHEQNRWAVSIQRARAIRDALVAEGIHPSRLRVSPKPGVHAPWVCQGCQCVAAAGRVVEVLVLANDDGPTDATFTSAKTIAKPGAR